MRLINCLFFFGVAGFAVPEMSLPVAAQATAEPAVKRCIRPEAIDGDTIRCGRRGYRVSHRLLGIDAPELAGHCRRGRSCAPGDPQASRAALAAAIEDGATVQAFGTDVYKRRLSIVRTKEGQNVSCLQLKAGQAIFKPKWDKGERIKRECV
jgi:endonuclease YncB( thermonuclease family)